MDTISRVESLLSDATSVSQQALGDVFGYSLESPAKMAALDIMRVSPILPEQVYVEQCQIRIRAILDRVSRAMQDIVDQAVHCEQLDENDGEYYDAPAEDAAAFLRFVGYVLHCGSPWRRGDMLRTDMAEMLACPLEAVDDEIPEAFRRTLCQPCVIWWPLLCCQWFIERETA
jgi:hypothetical protein